MRSWRCPFLSENQHLLDRFSMVQRNICLDVFLELFRIVLPTGFIASELVCCFDMMDAMPGNFWWCLWLVKKNLCQMQGTRTSQEGFCYLTGIIRNLFWLLLALGRRPWLSLWHQIHLMFATALRAAHLWVWMDLPSRAGPVGPLAVLVVSQHGQAPLGFL